jgi:hypothetical protein
MYSNLQLKFGENANHLDLVIEKLKLEKEREERQKLVQKLSFEK